MKKKTVLIDVDNVLYSTKSYAMDIAKNWDTDSISNLFLALLEEPIVYEIQPLKEDAQSFVNKCNKYADVYFKTSVPECCRPVYLKRISEDFPEIPLEKILFVSDNQDDSKFTPDFQVEADIYSLKNSKARIPVLFKKGGDIELNSGLLTCSYNQLLNFVQTI